LGYLALSKRMFARGASLQAAGVVLVVSASPALEDLHVLSPSWIFAAMVRLALQAGQALALLLWRSHGNTRSILCVVK
jgi:hypothetical protein